MKSQPQKYMCAFIILLTMTLAFFGAHSYYNKGVVIFVADTPTPQPGGDNQTWPPDTRSPDPAQLSDQAQTLLVTFGRSGSSFTSNIISYHRDVFFAFEPLTFLSKPDEIRRVPWYFQTVGLEDLSKRVVESYLTCDFHYDALKTFGNKHLLLSNSTDKFFSCFTQKNTTGMEHLDCYFDLVQTCRRHKMKLVKTIRFPVKWAGDLMQRYPRMKVLYLVRDPRATLLSQALVFRKFQLPRDIVNVSARHCQWLSDDLLHLEQLRDEFPGRVKVVRYEHGAMDPMGYTREIYDFLGLSVTQELMEYVKYLTSPEKKAEKNKDSTTEASRGSHQKPLSTTEEPEGSRESETTEPSTGETSDNRGNWARGGQGRGHRIRKKVNETENLDDRMRLGLVAMVNEPESNGEPKAGQQFRKLLSSSVQASRALTARPRTNLKRRFDTRAMPAVKAPQSKGDQKTVPVPSLLKRAIRTLSRGENGAEATSTSAEEKSQWRVPRRRRETRSRTRTVEETVKDPYGIHRDDPRRAMEHWRYQLGIKMTKVVDTYCGHLYPQLGYRMVTTQHDLENTSEISLVTDPLSEEII